MTPSRTLRHGENREAAGRTISVLLLDIDGTLTPGLDVNHQSAVLAALDDVFDMQVPIDEFRAARVPGLDDSYRRSSGSGPPLPFAAASRDSCRCLRATIRQASCTLRNLVVEFMFVESAGETT